MRVGRFGTAVAALTAGAGLVLGTTGVAQAAPVTQQATAVAPAASSLTAPITGTFTDALGGVGTFTGNFALTRIINQNGTLAAVGTLTGTLTNSVGTVLGTVTQQVTVPLQAAGTCDILHLTLGPLDLNLLGLVVHLDRVVLDITAQSGSGNLLGNLLCAVAHLLDNNGNGALNGVAALLNRILSLLG